MTPDSTLILESGMHLTHGSWHLELRRPLAQSGRAWHAIDMATQRPMWVWRAPANNPERWLESILKALSPNAPSDTLPDYITHWTLHDTHTLVLLKPPGHKLCACDELLWKQIPTHIAIDALRALIIDLHHLHEAHISLAGVKRTHLHWDEEAQRLLIASMPHARPLEDTEEELWRDIRLIGDMLFEKLLGRPCPNGHELAALLQDPIRMQEVGLTQPGLIQLLAGCVTPYGDLAFVSHEHLLGSLTHLQSELSTPLRFRVAQRSTMGISIFRKNNQDSCAHLELSHRCSSRTVTHLFACVADGIGGIRDGERASALAVHTACEVFTRAWAHADRQDLVDAPVDHARAITKVVSQRLAMEGEFTPGGNRGGTTFSAALIADGQLGIAHVGDSRIYLIRHEQITQLTTDHTLATILNNLGELGRQDPKPEDVRERTISRFLTTSMELPLAHIDTFCGEALERLKLDPQRPLRRGITLLTGDRLLLVSDGVHSGISHEDLLGLSMLHPQPEDFCQAVIDLSLDTMSRDNVTALVIDTL